MNGSANFTQLTKLGLNEVLSGSDSSASESPRKEVAACQDLIKKNDDAGTRFQSSGDGILELLHSLPSTVRPQTLPGTSFTDSHSGLSGARIVCSSPFSKL